MSRSATGGHRDGLLLCPAPWCQPWSRTFLPWKTSYIKLYWFEFVLTHVRQCTQAVFACMITSGRMVSTTIFCYARVVVYGFVLKGGWAGISYPFWIQADLGSNHLITSVTTQGRHGYSPLQCVTSYYVSYKADGNSSSWQDVWTLYSGNSDANTWVTNELPPGIVARYVRLRPQAWVVHPTMRWNVMGCPYTATAGKSHFRCSHIKDRM